MVAVADITHDAASLNRFVESIQRFCDLRRGFPAYLAGSKDFLSLIERLAESTKEYVSAFPANLPSNPDDYQVYRQELLTLRYAWFDMHRLVKPIADADTLHLPGSLINAMMRRLRSVPSFQDSKLAILHISELNYLQVIASGVRDTITKIADFVGSSLSFPPDLGLIGIPYSQADSVLLNSLIAHEMGHFVFEKQQLKDDLAPKIEASLDPAFKPAMDLLQKQQIDANSLKRIPSVLASWTEELFCDLFAIRFIGPCYSYAFIELFDLSNYMNRDGTLRIKAGAPPLQFSHSYPGHLYRLQKQAEMLRTLGWWTHIQNSQATSQKLLEHAEALPASSFCFPFHVGLQKCFIDLT